MAIAGTKIDTHQHGFVNNRSCTTNLVGLCDSLSLTLSENVFTDVVYFDFSKAFATVNHDILLSKLKNIFNINNCIVNQFTNSDGDSSKGHCVNCYVKQFEYQKG